MTEVNHNLSHLATEFRDLPSSLANFLDSIDGFVQKIDENFSPDQLSNVVPFVDSYNQVRKDVRALEDKSQMLLEYLNGEEEPSEPDDIDDIKRAVYSLIDSVEEFANQTENITNEFIELGLEEQAEALQEVTTQFKQLPPSIRSSLLDNQLFFVLKAQYFPDAASGDISDYVYRLDSLSRQGRQNVYGAFVLVASANPEEILEYSDELAKRLSDATRGEQQNILGLLVLVTEADSTPSNTAINEVLKLIHSEDETIALYAAMLLGNHTTTKRQAELVSGRIADLLRRVSEDEVRINATSVLCGLAESYPAQVRDLVPDVAALLESQHPSVQENVIEFLERTNATEYRTQISEIHSRTDDEDVWKAADSALDELSETDLNSNERGSDTSTVASDSLLSEIEDEFSQM